MVRTACTTFERQVQGKNHTAMGGLCGFCPAFQTTFDKTQTSYLVQSINPELKTVCYGLVQHPRLSSYKFIFFSLENSVSPHLIAVLSSFTLYGTARVDL